MPSFKRLALPALALAGTAFAQCDSDFTIQNAGDAQKLSSCSTYEGTLTISKECSDDIDLSGIQELKGDLVLESNADIKRISASDLESVKKLTFNDVQNLASCSFPKLTAATDITLTGLPNLRQLDWSTGVKNCSNLRVENTQLQNLDGINVAKAKSIVVAGNTGIAEFSMQTTSISGALEISHNNDDLEVKLPNLESAQNATFRAVKSLDLSSLKQIIKGSLGLFETTGLESFILPNLTTVDGPVTIVGNEVLNNISFPLLKNTTQNLQIANNSELNDLSDSFPSLQDVGASLDISGNITELATPKLTHVKGTTNLQSTDQSGSFKKACDDFYNKNINSGKFGSKKGVCKGSTADPKKIGEGGSSGSSDKTGAASTIGVQGVVYLVFAGLAAALVV